MNARQQAEEMVSQLTPQWLYEAAKRHEEVEKQMPPEFQHERLENEGGMFLQSVAIFSMRCSNCGLVSVLDLMHKSLSTSLTF